MRLLTCPEEKCGIGEMWDSSFEIDEHYQKNHPGRFGVLDVTGEFIQGYDLINDEPLEEGYAEWAQHYKYGSANIERQGLYGVFTRMRDDKMARIANAMNGTVANGRVVIDTSDWDAEAEDTVEDGFGDTANYSFIEIALMKGEWGKPLQEDMDD